MERVIVTGGAGFIGHHVCERILKEGYEPVVVDDLSTGKMDRLLPGCKFIEQDIVAADLQEIFIGAKFIIHLAAIASVEICSNDPVGSSRVNAMGSVAVFDAAANLNIPVVFASSAAVYGNPMSVPISESAPLNPISVYGMDKLYSEKQADILHETKGLKFCAVRFFNVYGNGQDPNSSYTGVISKFIDQAQNDSAISIYGDGLQTRDFVHVSDIAEIVLSCGIRLSNNVTVPKVMNVGTGQQTSILRLAEVISKTLKRELDITFVAARNDDIRDSQASIDRISEAIGKPFFVGIEDGLSELLQQNEILDGT